MDPGGQGKILRDDYRRIREPAAGSDRNAERSEFWKSDRKSVEEFVFKPHPIATRLNKSLVWYFK